MALLMAYPWPGNVREMENEIARCLVLAGDRGDLGPDDLSDKVRQATPQGAGSAAGGPLADLGRGSMVEQVEVLERELMLQAQRASQGNKSQMARLLGLSREGLRKKMARFAME